ncbi:MAG: hypothetical protein HQM08_25610 [Candidatus Riflebacteria bacterium]|nr:hypothetical protein [Candidatus Riflebacteria bacterium]
MLPINVITEKRVQEFADKNGYTTEKDPTGKTIVKDKNSKFVPIPPEVFQAQLGNFFPPGLELGSGVPDIGLIKVVISKPCDTNIKNPPQTLGQ